MTADHVVVFPSELGWMAAAWRGEWLWELTFGHRSPQDAQRGLRRSAGTPRDPEPFQRDCIHQLQRFAAHGDSALDGIAVDLSEHTSFQRRIVEACRAIPVGETITYAQLALAAGHPGAARAAGQVMATNCVPLVIPCHRVVGSGGSLGGYSAPEGLVMKRRLLDLERQGVASAVSPVPAQRSRHSAGA